MAVTMILQHTQQLPLEPTEMRAGAEAAGAAGGCRGAPTDTGTWSSLSEALVGGAWPSPAGCGGCCDTLTCTGCQLQGVSSHGFYRSE